MKQRFPRILGFGVFFLCMVIGMGIVVLMQTTYSESQLQQAGQEYLVQLGKEYEDCSLKQKRWYNDQLFCLYEDGKYPFVIGFSKNDWFPDRFSPFCFCYPTEQAGDGVLYDFAKKGKGCYTYVVFGPRPKGIHEIEVDVLDKAENCKGQYHNRVDPEEEYILYVLQKYEKDPIFLSTHYIVSF